jgi:hypothetical protein
VAEVLFKPRYALKAVCNPDMDWLHDVILNPCRPGQEFGEATLTYRDAERVAEMVLIADRELGYYLKYELVGDSWLSLGDPGRLAEVVCPDDWEASAGLFVSPERAWVAIHDFCLSGVRSKTVEWVRPTEIPEAGNW